MTKKKENMMQKRKSSETFDTIKEVMPMQELGKFEVIVLQMV